MRVVICLLLFSVACLELDPKHDSDLSGTLRGQTYVKTVLSDFGVRKNNRGFDTDYETLLHYISFTPRLHDKAVQLGSEKFKDTGGVFKFDNVLLSYQKEQRTYTCRLENVPFASESAIDESAACFSSEDSNNKDAYLFASMCVEHGGIVFHKGGKDFSCNLADCAANAVCSNLLVNVDCIVGGTSYGDACTAVKELWNEHKNEQTKSSAFVAQLRATYAACEYNNSQLTCTSTNSTAN